MAKIVLITEKLTATAVSLTIALRQQQHQVTVLTSVDEDAKLPDDVALMRPFRRWSLVEAFRMAPILFSLDPQVVHLVLEEDRLNTAQILLSLVSKALPRCVLTTSVLNIRDGLRRSNPVRYLLQESDIVTCPSVESLGALRGLNVKSRRQGRGLLPPTLDLNDQENRSLRSGAAVDLQKNLKDQNYFVMPFFETDFDPRKAVFRRLALIATHRHVLLLGSFSAWNLRERKRFQSWMETQGLGAQWTLSGELSPIDLRRLLSKCEAFVIAGLLLNPHESNEYFLRAIHAGATIILDDVQSTLHPDLWRHGENCWILPKDKLFSSLQALLSRDHLNLPKALPENLNFQRDLLDAPLNELNRLYNKALAHKHLP